MNNSAASSRAYPGPAASVRPLFSALAIVTLASAILLILIGSIVRVSGHGLGCPDWPLCYGRPIPPLITGAWVEFSHRLVAGIVALQVAGLVLLAWRHFRGHTWHFRPALAALLVVLLQAALGGLHVLRELPAWTGWIHTAVAMALVGLLAILVGQTQPALHETGRRVATLSGSANLRRWAALTAAAVYLLLLTGSLVTRTGSSLACPAFPGCGLETIPAELRPFVEIQMAHRLAAFLVAALVALLAWRLWGAAGPAAGLRHFALALVTLLVVQFFLGVSNVLFALPMWSRALHLVVGASIWVTAVILWVTLRGEPR